MTQLIEQQARAHEIAIDPSQKPSVACFAMRSFCSLQEERRKLEMRPLPKAIDVTHLHRSKKKHDDSGIAPAAGSNP